MHGLWLHGDSWTPWIERFRAAGYSPTAPGWPGTGASVEATRRNSEAVAGYGIGDIVEHYARIIKALDPKPIVIGHSFGGLIAQRLLADDRAAAAVAIDPAPIRGVTFLPPSALSVAWIALRNPANRKPAVSLTQKQVRRGFANAVSEEATDLYDRWAIPTPGKPCSRPHGPTSRATPAGTDRTVPNAISRATVKLHRHSPVVTQLHEFPDRGHSLTDRQRLARSSRCGSGVARRVRALESVTDLPAALTLHVGERRRLRQRGLAQAGYRWKASVESGAEVVDVETMFDDAEHPAIVPAGRFAAEVLSIAARAPGRARSSEAARGMRSAPRSSSISASRSSTTSCRRGCPSTAANARSRGRSPRTPGR